MIVCTKLHIPSIRRALVHRPRLMRMLNEGMNAKLTLVSAQAGYGKTTALSEWVNQCGSAVAWVSLDKQDNDWVQFWRYITAAIQRKAPGFGTRQLALLEKGIAAETAAKELLNELAELTEDWVIVLDDYHVIELPDIHHSLSYLLEHLPPHIHFYMASRIDLPIPTARLLAKGELHCIRAQDLRFQLEEGIRYFRDTTDLLLTHAQMTELLQQTEGWISGLQLAAISLKRSDHIAESIRQFSGRQLHISDYLLEEVFLQLPEPLRVFLLETSILSRMNHALCEAVTGQTNCQEQLERLLQMNLFIIPLDERRNWFRYHHLLADFLQQLGARTNPDKKLRAHIHAAKWLENQGYDEEAVEHYLEGKEVREAIRLIEKNLPGLMQFKSKALRRWFSALPEMALVENPNIDMLYISVLIAGGQGAAALRRAEQAKVRVESLRETLPDESWRKLMGNVCFFCAVITFLQKDMERASDYFELAESYMPEGSCFQMAGRNRFQGSESFDDLLTPIHDLRAAEKFLLKWMKAWETKKDYPFVGYIYGAYSSLLYEWNRLEEAELVIQQVSGRADLRPFARLVTQITICSSKIMYAQGQTHRAAERLIELKSTIDSPDYDFFLFRIEAEQAHLSLRQGVKQAALDWLQRCELRHTDEVSLPLLPEYLVLARAMAACDRITEALHLVEALFRLVDKEERFRDRIKVNIVRSILLWRSGQKEAALTHLGAALQLAHPEGYIRSFIDEGAVMGEMLAAYLRLQQGKRLPSVSLAYIKQLRKALNGISENDLSLHDRLTEKELKVLHFAADGLSNKEIADCMNIKGETVKFHLSNLYSKLGVKNRVQALRRADQLHLLG